MARTHPIIERLVDEDVQRLVVAGAGDRLDRELSLQ